MRTLTSIFASLMLISSCCISSKTGPEPVNIRIKKDGGDWFRANDTNLFKLSSLNKGIAVDEQVVFWTHPKDSINGQPILELELLPENSCEDGRTFFLDYGNGDIDTVVIVPECAGRCDHVGVVEVQFNGQPMPLTPGLAKCVKK